MNRTFRFKCSVVCALTVACLCLAPNFSLAQSSGSCFSSCGCCDTGSETCCTTTYKTCTRTTYETRVSCRPVTTCEKVCCTDACGCPQTKCVPKTTYVQTCETVPVTTTYQVPQTVCHTKPTCSDPCSTYCGTSSSHGGCSSCGSSSCNGGCSSSCGSSKCGKRKRRGGLLARLFRR